MSDRWTPGPWRFNIESGYRKIDVVTAENANLIAELPFSGSMAPEANARLISAAPDMAEALNSIARCLAPGHRTMDELIRDQDLACAIARAALAKARGQA